VALKIFTRDEANQEEYDMYQYLRTCSATHPGFRHVRTALDAFSIPRSGGTHRCIVQKPLWESFKELLNRNPSHRFTEELLKAGLHQTLLALDYLHTECHVVHTGDIYIERTEPCLQLTIDIKADNILQDVKDHSVFDDFVKDELEHPSPREFVEGSPIYLSRQLNLPRSFGEPVLSDFGSAVRGDVEHTENVQPKVYRSPEVMLKMPWSYPVQDKHLFYGIEPTGWNPNGDGYTTRAHLAEIVGMLGPPPLDFLKRGERSREFFTEDGMLSNNKTVSQCPITDLYLGKWCAEIEVVQSNSLEESEENLEGENKALFLKFVRSMLQWRPEDRKTARELLDDPWLYSNVELSWTTWF